MDALDCSRTNAENFSPQGAVPQKESAHKFQKQNAEADELVGRKIEMEGECPPAFPGKRCAEWLMLSKREEGQTGLPRSPRKHDKRASWGISLLIPSEAPPAEVIKGRLYVGSRAQAQNWTLLQTLGITHIVNVSRDSKEPFEGKIKYHQCSIADKDDVDISVPGARSWEFIESAFEDASSCVLVHCASGVSRAVTITTYYLMRKESIPCEAALQRIRYGHPAACPNGSFVAQLTALNSSLARGSCPPNSL